tara:strand:+ start:51203 stop:51997 length:795 start_codon:yes stop_codon:yes gene_type:complete
VRKGLYVSVLVLTTLCWIAVMMPAQTLLYVLKSPALQVAGLSGTVWNGAARQVALADGEIYFDAGQLRWTLKPYALLRGNLCADFSAEKTAVMRRGASQSITGSVCAGLSGNLVLSDTSLELPASVLLRSEEIRLTGIITGHVEHFAVDAGSVLQRLSARGLWTGAGMNVGTGSSQLRFQAGDLPFAIVGSGPQSMQLTADNLQLAAASGRTGIDLTAELETTGDVSLELRIVAESSMPERARDWLAVLAEQRSTSEYYLEWRR